MFTGLVAELGRVVGVETGPEGARMRVRAEVLRSREVGDSVAVDGVCLTVIERQADVCAFEVSAETLRRSTLGSRGPGDAVNLEPPLRADGELGGHIVQGHVDAVGRIVEVRQEGEGRLIRVELPVELCRYIVPKGSVTVDGVSLTVTEVGDGSFGVALVPHTLAVTTAGSYEAGREVNVELDIIGKYVERLVGPWRGAALPHAGSDRETSKEARCRS